MLDKLYNQLNIFILHSKFEEFLKGETLISPQKKIDSIFFIKKGLIRSYRIVDGYEVTHHFHKENWFVTDYEGFLKDNQGDLYFEMATDCLVYSLNKTVWFSLLEKHHEMEKLGRIVAEQAYLQMVERVQIIQTKSLKAKYDIFLKEYPDIHNLVPQKHIATYLGATPQSLSRIKSKSK